MSKPDKVPRSAYQHFCSLSKDIGAPADLQALPYSQLGSLVQWDSLPLAGTSAKAFSVLPQQTKFSPPSQPPTTIYAWHNIMFCNDKYLTYFSPHLIRKRGSHATPTPCVWQFFVGTAIYLEVYLSIARQENSGCQSITLGAP